MKSAHEEDDMEYCKERIKEIEVEILRLNAENNDHEKARRLADQLFETKMETNKDRIQKLFAELSERQMFLKK